MFDDLDFLLETFEPVAEGYVGKTKNILEIERLLGVMIKKYGTTNIIENSRMTLDACPEKKKIEELVKKEFGFGHVTIVIKPQAIINAFTIPSGFIMRDLAAGMPQEATKHGDRWYDEKHQYVFYMAFYTEDFNGTFTPGELTAMLLHEIGHNFDVSTAYWFADCMFWGLCIGTGLFFMPAFKQTIGILIYSIDHMLDYIFPVRVVRNIIEIGKRYLSIAMGPFKVIDYLMAVGGQFAHDPVGTASSMLTGFGMEKFSDSFAAAYGYGPETISLMDKLDKVYMTTKMGSAIDTYTWIGQLAPTFLLMFIDPHPENQTRAKMVLEDLQKASSDKNVPPQIRKMMYKDYQLAKKTYDAYLQVEPDKKDAVAVRLSRHFKDFAFGGKIDLRSYLFSASALQNGGWRYTKRVK